MMVVLLLYNYQYRSKNDHNRLGSLWDLYSYTNIFFLMLIFVFFECNDYVDGQYGVFFSSSVQVHGPAERFAGQSGKGSAACVECDTFRWQR
jgi:hypothetical protein